MASFNLRLGGYMSDADRDANAQWLADIEAAKELRSASTFD